MRSGSNHTGRQTPYLLYVFSLILLLHGDACGTYSKVVHLLHLLVPSSDDILQPERGALSQLIGKELREVPTFTSSKFVLWLLHIYP
jgi:hypothetical protein